MEHDGKPLTSRDVKYTFNEAREAPEAPTKFRLSARRSAGHVEAIEAAETQTAWCSGSSALSPLLRRSDAGLGRTC